MFRLRLSHTIKGCFTSGACGEEPATSPPGTRGGAPHGLFDDRLPDRAGRAPRPRSPSTPERVDEPQASFRSIDGGVGASDDPNWRPLGVGLQSRPALRDAAVDELVEVLRSGGQGEQADAAEMLFNAVIESAERRGAVSVAGAVVPLVIMLSTGSPKGQLYAAYTLSSLTSVEGCRQEMEDAGAIGALLTMVGAPDTTLDGRKGAVRALGRLARNDSAAGAIVHAGGLPHLIGLLDSNEPGLLKRALVCLYFVGADKEELQAEIVRSGAVPRLVALCGSSHGSVQAEAADVCKVLARSTWCAREMAAGGAIEALVRVADDGLSNRSKENAFKALQRISDKGPELRDRIVGSGAGGAASDISNGEIQQLVGIINSGDPQLREQAAQVIEQVAAADPRASRDLAEPEVVSSLIDLLSTGSDEGRAYAAWAIARLAEDIGVRDKIYYTGAVLPLIHVLRECPGRGQEGAARALEKLASHKDAANTIISEGQLSAFLSALDSGNEQTQLHGARTLFLLRGVDTVVHSQIVATGGVPVLIRRCWRGSSEVQALALAVLVDLVQSSKSRHRIVEAGAVPVLLDMEVSQIPDVAQMSREALGLLSSKESLVAEVEAERDLQAGVQIMLERVTEAEGVRPARSTEEVLRLIPRGAFVDEHQVDEAYDGNAVSLSNPSIELPPLHIHILTLDVLQLQPGQSFLDVQCGTGFLTCMGAYLVGDAGRSVGLAEEAAHCAFAEGRVEQLKGLRGMSGLDPKFKTDSILSFAKSVERFDKISIEGACPKKILAELLSLLRPGGRMVVPCEGQLLLLREETGIAGAEVICPCSAKLLPCVDIARRLASSLKLDLGDVSANGKSPSRAEVAPPSKIPHVGGRTRSPRSPRPGSARANSQASARVARAFTPRGTSRLMAASSSEGTPSARLAHAGRDSPSWHPSHGASLSGSGSEAGSPEGDAVGRAHDAHWRSQQQGSDEGEVGPSQPPPDRRSSSHNRSPRHHSASGHIQHQREDKNMAWNIQGNGKVLAPLPDREVSMQPFELDVPGELQGLILSMNDIEICRNAEGKKYRLGEGGFGMVYKALMNNVDEVAVKVVKTDKPTNKELNLFLTEVKTLSQLHHRNIVQFYGACLELSSMFFVTELMRGGDLYTAIRHHQETMRWERLGKKVALDVALGLNYLHSQKPPMMHRDLKSPNVLLSEEGVAKIADVGMVKVQVKELMSAQPVMTPLWAAPEVLRKESANIKADVWSYGILIWELVSQADITEYQSLAMTRQMVSDKGKVVVLPHKCPPVAAKLFNACTAMVADDRPSMQQVVEWLRADGN
ncbi:unnamed protein product [Ostreobium quekettii]|uniref:Protein kinase domain-containing protein n=1 Tax=Ostreobium quekettii TaxID=121088 RepID=A0A8S1INW3_9CHLO|nr:unnamed protein product [Ostreobium quekettii]|eukprot:evm.model.scf_412.5 EVM.evm.TU.scf_412.5   scf_412:28635-42031(+)